MPKRDIAYGLKLARAVLGYVSDMLEEHPYTDAELHQKLQERHNIKSPWTMGQIRKVLNEQQQSHDVQTLEQQQPN